MLKGPQTVCRGPSLPLGRVRTLVGHRDPPVTCSSTRLGLSRHGADPNHELLSAPLIVMRAGYLMHRLLHRLLGGRTPSVSYSTDGGEMGKLMVAEGLGATVLPDFSLVDDPLERGGQITWRPLRDDDTEVWLVIRRTRSASHPLATRNLHSMFVERARALEPGRTSHAGTDRARTVCALRTPCCRPVGGSPYATVRS
jgi:DNA-binding transcriptional LysR family regulator